MLLDFYLFRRNDEFQIVCVAKGNDPMHGYGSWNKYSGPFETWEIVNEAFKIEEQKCIQGLIPLKERIWEGM